MTEREKALQQFPPKGSGRFIKYVPAVNLWSTPYRRIVDELEKLHKGNLDAFYRLLNMLRQELKRREKGRDPKEFLDLSIPSLKEAIKEGEALYH